MNTRDTTDQLDTGAEETPRSLPWWTPWATGLAVAVVVIGFGSWIVATQGDPGSMDDMTGLGTDAPEGLPPIVTGYYEGEQIEFLHTETSDAEVAQMLTDMMDGSPVVHTPALANASADMVAPVYVFTSGVKPDGPRGPFGYQPDVFDTVPSDQGYSALRSVQLVEWSDGTEPRALTSASEVIQAEQAGEVTVSASGIVVNMPITTWPGGSR